MIKPTFYSFTVNTRGEGEIQHSVGLDSILRKCLCGSFFAVYKKKEDPGCVQQEGEVCS